METPYFVQRKKMLEEMEVTLHPRPKNSNIDKSYYTPQQVKSHNYNMTINEAELCSKNNKIFLLILYRTIYAHVKWREIIRQLFNIKNINLNHKGLIVKYLFIFGNSGDPHMENLIRNESKHYRDIIQEDFHESYFNLTKKVITAWKWTVNYCPNAEYVMILNDELLLDLDKIISFLMQDYSMGHHDDRFAICYPRFNKKPLFLSQRRYQVMPRNRLYKGKRFPSYCHGWGYAAHVKVINKLYKASFTSTALMPTDAWIGILSEKLRLGILDHTNRYVLHNIEKYFADPLYQTSLGMIAVTDVDANKNHELKVMKSFLKSMLRHSETKANIMQYLFAEPKEYARNRNYFYYTSHILVFIITIFCIFMFCKFFRTRVLQLCNCKNSLIKK